jgi:hypothetical protein
MDDWEKAGKIAAEALELGKKLPDCFTIGLYSGLNKELEQYISSPTKYKELNPKYKRRI